MEKEIYDQELAEWNLNASHYELENKLPFQQVIYREIYQKSGFSSKYKKILDAGCGAGHFAAFIQRKTGNQIVGVDFAKEMINVAQKKYPKIDFICTSAEKLPFKNNSFDAIFAISLLHHLKAQDLLQKGAREFYRVLKPKGLFIAVDRQDKPLPNFFEAIFAVFKKVFKFFKGKHSASGTVHEVAIAQKDISILLKQGFILLKQAPICSLLFKILGVATNFILYLFGQRIACRFQKLTSPLAVLSERNLNLSWLSTDRCLVFKK